VLAAVKTLIETGSALPDVEPGALAAAADADEAWHRSQAIEANNSIWELLDAPRGADDDEELVRRAYAAAYHWDRAAGGGPEHAARAAYMVAKAQLAVGQAAVALAAADRCMALCVDHGLADFDLAYAHEARARGLQALGRAAEAEAEWQAAHEVPIADPQDREILDGDLAVPLA
jgi:tetratricopeptide (TPR) repeat protein